MKRLAAVLVTAFMALSGPSFADEVRKLDLDPNRTSVEYGKQILETLAVLEKHKWVQEDEDYNGMTFAQVTDIEFNWQEDYLVNGIFAQVYRHTFDTVMRDYLSIGRKSHWDGYVEFWEFHNPKSSLHFKVVDDKTLKVRFSHLGSKDYIFKAVDEFRKTEKLKRDYSDIIF